jgi:hypothetical protein
MKSTSSEKQTLFSQHTVCNLYGASVFAKNELTHRKEGAISPSKSYQLFISLSIEQDQQLEH